ncbi:MAG: hypothetical protein ACUVSV_09195 [Armatimonadota bacterium]
MSGSLVLCFLSMLAADGAEPVVLPPVWKEAQWVQHLISSPLVRNVLEADYHLLAHTNVKPLLQNSKAQSEFTGGYGYYDYSSSGKLCVSLSRWRLSYLFGVTDLFGGNNGGTQLYLHGLNRLQIPSGTLAVTAALNRSAVNRWTLEHFTPVRARSGNGWICVAGSLYLSRRIQQGALTGAWQNEQLDGNLVLDSTRGLDPADTRSVGVGLHLALSLPLSERWQFGLWGENLVGHLWQRKVRRITARVQVNTIIPDADGVLHAAPLLSGRIDDLSENLPLQRQVTFGLAHRTDRGTWLLFASHRAGWSWAVGRTLRNGWLLLYLPDRQLQAGWRAGQWRIQLGLSNLNPLQAKHATLGMGWAIPLSP